MALQAPEMRALYDLKVFVVSSFSASPLSHPPSALSFAACAALCKLHLHCALTLRRIVTPT